MAFGFVNPLTNTASPPPARAVNASRPPWAYTATGKHGSKVLTHPTDHSVVGHPNAVHFAVPQVTPFAEGTGALNGLITSARRHTPVFMAPGGLSGGARR